MRDEAFGATLFGEPAWDLLLDLYVAACEQRPVSLIAASMAASVSTEDAVRWFILLEEHGLVERVYTGSEMSRAIVTLSRLGFERMTRLLQRLS
jgi:hypothetical protein